MHRGYVKLWRKSIDTAIWEDETLWRLWTLCLMKASHKNTETIIGRKKVKISRGSFITGRQRLWEDFYPSRTRRNRGFSPLSLWRSLKFLEKLGNLNINSNNKFSIVSINNYDTYNSCDSEDEQHHEQQLNNKRTTSEQQLNTYKNNKNNKNNKNKKAYMSETGNSENDISESDSKNKIPCKEILDLYHSLCPDLPKVRSTKKLFPKIRSRWRDEKDRQSLEWWKCFFQEISESRFLTGKVNGWKANLSWIVGPENMEKILNGAYKSNTRGGGNCNLINMHGRVVSENQINNMRALEEARKGIFKNG